ncbi:conserved hypothetical protein [uncultured delta proteobacterium]|uniref:DUF6475 domain-containing protein n=1 Tax=uncultured delta proteobacterium TaxID=34034 RepID=A0A212K1K9_9DELT|nr:conserved hypothetical protein [uncultured delta proteobacterium]
MKPEDFDRFDALIQGVADCYGQTLTAQGIAMRFKMLEQFEFPEVERAALSIMATRKYTSMPTPADFLEHLGGGSIEDRAEVEAGKVLQAIGRHGGYASVVFDDPTTQAVIVQAYGGWAQMCAECGVEESEKWFRVNFAKSWAAYKRQGVQVFGVLAGIFEIQNSANGFLEHIPQPKLVGNPEKAQAVLEAGRQQALEATQRRALPEAQPAPVGSAQRGSHGAPASIGEILSIAGVTQ